MFKLEPYPLGPQLWHMAVYTLFTFRVIAALQDTERRDLNRSGLDPMHGYPRLMLLNAIRQVFGKSKRKFFQRGKLTFAFSNLSG